MLFNDSVSKFHRHPDFFSKLSDFFRNLGFPSMSRTPAILESCSNQCFPMISCRNCIGTWILSRMSIFPKSRIAVILEKLGNPGMLLKPMLFQWFRVGISSVPGFWSAPGFLENEWSFPKSRIAEHLQDCGNPGKLLKPMLSQWFRVGILSAPCFFSKRSDFFEI